jgi:regulator of cell morphogenesis and NO signaling
MIATTEVAPSTTLPLDPDTTRIADLAREHPATIRVFQRHGIDFCCGGKRTLAEACTRRGQELAPLLADLAVALGSTDQGPAALASLPATLADLAKLIVGRYHVALRSELPRLLQMADKVERVHGADLPEVLPPLAATLRAFAAELAAHMESEEAVLFPAIERLEAAVRRGQPAAAVDLGQLVAAHEAEHDTAGAALARMRALTAAYTPPDWACNTFRGLFHGLAELEEQMHEHVHLENNILFPRALALAGA